MSEAKPAAAGTGARDAMAKVTQPGRPDSAARSTDSPARDGNGHGAHSLGGGEPGWPTGLDPAAMTAFGQAWLELQREWVAGIGQLQRDYLTFVGERMRKDIEAAKRIAECRDVQAALELQSAFVETAREDYLSEAQKVINRSREMTQTCIERLAEAPARQRPGRH